MLSPLIRISTLFVGDQQPFSLRTNASQGNDGSYGLVVRSVNAVARTINPRGKRRSISC